MTAVDLIPNEFKTTGLRRKRLRLWLLVVTATTIATLVWAALNYLTFRGEDQALQQLARQSQDIEASIAQLHRTKEQLDLWQDRIAVIDKLGRYPDYVAITGYLSQSSPQLIYLKEMKFSRSDSSAPTAALPRPSVPPQSLPTGAKMFLLKDNQPPPDSTDATATDNTEPVLMALKGHSLDYQTVADYLNVLRDSDIFVGARLKHTKRRLGDSANTVNFEIQSILAPRRSSIGVDYADLQQTENL